MFYKKQVCFQFVLNLGDAVVKVVRLGEERHAMERGPSQARDRFLLGAEQVRMNDGVPFGAAVLENGKSRFGDSTKAAHTCRNTTVPKNLLVRILLSRIHSSVGCLSWGEE